MTQQIINTGIADAGNGDPIRTAFTKVNLNFTELYDSIAGGSSILTGTTAPVDPSEGDLWWDAESGRLYVYYGSTWVDASPVDGAGISSTNELVNGAHTVSLDSTGVLTLPDGLTIDDSVIGYTTSDTITEGNNSQTTSYQNQIIVDTTDAIRISNVISQTVNDGVTTVTDSTGSTIDVDGTGAYIKRYVEPEGPNNSSYFQVSTTNSGAILEGVEEDLAGNAYGRVTATQGVVTINAAAGGIDKEWVFISDGDLYLPQDGTITGTNDVYVKSLVDGNSSGLFLNGNTLVGTAMLYANGNAIIRADNNGTAKDWTFGKNATLTTPLLLPKTFTAVLDDAHRSAGDAIVGDPWQFEVAFVVGLDGVVETQMDNPFPNLDNPGYASGDEYEFSEEDHGIPGFTFVITLNDVVLPGGAGWTANVAVTPPPEYPSTVSSLGAIKLTANDQSFVFGADGVLTVPGNIRIGELTIQEGAPALTVATGNNLAIGTSRYETVSADAYIGLNDLFSADIEFNDDITVVQVGWIVNISGTDYTVTEVDASVGNQYRITAAGATFVTGTNYTFRNPTPVPYTWVVGNDGVLTSPANGTIAHQDNDLKLEVTGTDVIVLRTGGGDVYVDASGKLNADRTVINYLNFDNQPIQVGQAGGGTFAVAMNRFQVLATAPTSSIGSEGDFIGCIAFSATHIYYCTGLYDGTTNIWKRIAWSNDTW